MAASVRLPVSTMVTRQRSAGITTGRRGHRWFGGDPARQAHDVPKEVTAELSPWRAGGFREVGNHGVGGGGRVGGEPEEVPGGRGG